MIGDLDLIDPVRSGHDFHVDGAVSADGGTGKGLRVIRDIRIADGGSHVACDDVAYDKGEYDETAENTYRIQQFFLLLFLAHSNPPVLRIRGMRILYNS